MANKPTSSEERERLVIAWFAHKFDMYGKNMSDNRYFTSGRYDADKRQLDQITDSIREFANGELTEPIDYHAAQAYQAYKQTKVVGPLFKMLGLILEPKAS